MHSIQYVPMHMLTSVAMEGKGWERLTRVILLLPCIHLTPLKQQTAEQWGRQSIATNTAADRTVAKATRVAPAASSISIPDALTERQRLPKSIKA